MNRFKALVLFLALIVLIIACTPGAAPVPASPAQNQQNTTVAIETRKDWQVKWDNLLLAAKREGRLIIYSSGGPVVRQALIDGFGNKYGLQVDVVTGRGNELSEKILTEKRAGITLADVVHGGSTDMSVSLKPKGVLDPMEAIFFMPEVVEPEIIKRTWWNGELLWADNGHTIFVTFAYASAKLALNIDLVKPEELKSYHDLLQPKWKGKILLNDPTVSGGGGKWFSVFGSKILGWDYMRALARQEPVVLRNERLQVEWLARGRYPVLISPKSPIFFEFKEAGAPIWRGTPVEGSYLSGSGGTFALIKERPHPSTTQFFINWLVTKEGQTVLSKGYGLQSARLDVPAEEIDPSTIRQPGIKYFWADSEESLAQEPEYRRLAVEIFGHLVR